MSSPRQERADPVAVDRLLGAMEFAAVARHVEPGAALALDAPRATGAVQMGTLTTTFVLGAESPRPEGSAYLRVGDEPPVVVSKELVAALLAPSDVYRDRTVVPYLATELARFDAMRPDGGFSLVRTDEREFRVMPEGLAAARAPVNRVWAALAEMRAEAFPSDAEADRLTAHPVVTLKLTPKDGTKPPAELVVGEACPGHPADVVVLRKAPTRVAACAPKDILNALVATGSVFVERHPFTLGLDEIEELRLERLATVTDAVADAGAAGAPSVIEIARKGTGFHARAPFDRDLTGPEADAATVLVMGLTTFEATSVAAGAGSPFAAIARASVRLGEHQQVVEIGARRADGRATLRRLMDDARLDVDASLTSRLLPRATTLRPRTALDGENRRVTRVLLRCGTEQEIVDRGEGFRLVSPPGYETDGAIAQLVDAVTRGHVEAWVADGDDGTFGFARDACHVVFAFENGNTPVTLWFGGPGDGGVYARVDGAAGREGVMAVPRSWRELAGRIYVSRGSLRTDAATIEQVRVLVSGKPAPPGDPSVLRDAVSALYADRVVALHEKLRAPPELVIEVALAEGGPLRRIACSPTPLPAERLCTIDGVDATFAVPWSKLSVLSPPRDAGGAADARDQ